MNVEEVEGRNMQRIKRRQEEEEMMSKLKVYDNGGITADRYTVVFPTGDIYLMSRDADVPNGVCVYAGDNQEIIQDRDKEVDISELPDGTQRQIGKILELIDWSILTRGD